MRKCVCSSITILFFACLSFTLTAQTNELLLQVEQHLAALGYDTGPVDGAETLETTIAISKFQAENGLDVTGVATPELSGTMANLRLSGGAAVATTASAADIASLRTAQQTCLQEKIDARQAGQQRSRGLRSLTSAVSRVANRAGINLGGLNQVTQDIYTTNATAADLSQAARDLGLTEDDLETCRAPR